VYEDSSEDEAGEEGEMEQEEDKQIDTSEKP